MYKQLGLESCIIRNEKIKVYFLISKKSKIYFDNKMTEFNCFKIKIWYDKLLEFNNINLKNDLEDKIKKRINYKKNLIR